MAPRLPCIAHRSGRGTAPELIEDSGSSLPPSTNRVAGRFRKPRRDIRGFRRWDFLGFGLLAVLRLSSIPPAARPADPRAWRDERGCKRRVPPPPPGTQR